MANRLVERNGLLHFSSMLSVDPFLVGAGGYPLLFQSGETYQSSRLVDKQHPHDLFPELSIGYTQRLSAKADGFGYLGFLGEPALGAAAFKHRISAFHNPDAPLGHHWQDATHITFGVATVGVRYGIFKLESSRFTGREPNDKRLDFDRPRFDSYSFRLTANPTRKLSFQVSNGHITSPEP